MPTPHDRLIDAIYEASFSPPAWQTVFDGLCGLTGSASATIILTDHGAPPRGVGSRHIDAQFQQTIADPRWEFSLARARLSLEHAPHCFFPLNELYDPPLDSTDDVVETALRAVGLGHQVGTCVALPTTRHAFFTLERRLGEPSHDAAALAQADAMRPHLARAALLAQRLGLQQARNACDVMEHIGLPAAVLSPAGRVLAHNALLDASAVVRPAAMGRIVLALPAADAMLRSALDALRTQHVPPVASIPVATETGAAPTVIHLLPLQGSARDLFTGGMVLLVEARLHDSVGDPSPALLNALFDLTPREAQLAVALSRGETLAAFAQARGIQPSTARSHLERVLQKTATHQQSQLVALLRSVPWPGERPRA